MSEHHEELRLALVMNGGVSLAVWMGGVSNEIFRVVTGQHPVYLGLLEMTRTTARVDVISGTSAGGVNGAALSLALLYGGDFSRLRRVWLETGAFSSLLRAPLGENPGSLLRGDDFFLPEIQEAFNGLAPEPKPLFGPGQMPIDLRLTTTLLRGEQGHSVDDLGTAIHDVDYRAQFRFRHTRDSKDFDNRQAVVSALSRAARSTASFPFAFEPSPVKGLKPYFVDSGDRPIDDSLLKGTQEIVPRFVVDGGVLNNKPFRGALRSIFAMPAQRGVRRVLAYINPDPGDGPPGEPRKDAPPLASVLAASLFGIPQSQTIADQLAEIQAHNDHVRTRRDSVFDTVLRLSPEVFDQLPQQLFSLYRQHRLASTFDSFVLDELPAAARRLKLPAARAVVGRRGRARLLGVFMRVDWDGWIPREWPQGWAGADVELDEWRDERWEWGLFPVEFAIKVLLDVLRRTQHLSDLDPVVAGGQSRQDALAETGSRATSDRSEVSAPSTTTGDGSWQDSWHWVKDGLHRVVRDVGLATESAETWDREAVRQRAVPEDEPAHLWLRRAWNVAYGCVSRAADLRAEEQPIWNQRAEELVERMEQSGSPHEPDLDAVTPELFVGLFSFLIREERRRRCGQLMRHVSGALAEVAPQAHALALRVLAEDRPRHHDRAAAEQLVQFIERMVPLGAQATPAMVAVRLMKLEVIEHAHNAHEPLDDDCMIELAQFSGNSSSPLGGPTQAKDKLLGLQLAHFGAFYKQSWRANDWTYGRLDGSERMVKILMNPDRLRRFFEDSKSAVLRIKAIALDDIGSPVLRAEVDKIWGERGYEGRLLTELAFLDNHAAAIPDALPIATEVVTLRLHFGILREEIDPLLGAIAADRSQGADALGASDRFARRFEPQVDARGRRKLPFSPEQARAALEDGLIAGKNGESLLEEAGSDLFTRTLAHTVATLQGVLASKSAKLGPVSVFFAGLKLPVLGFYFVARGLTRQARTSAALHGGILAVGMALVAVQLILQQGKEPKSLPEAVLGFGWALLAYGLLFSIVSSPRVVGPLIVGVLLLLQYVLKIEVMPLLVVLGAAVVLWLSIRYRFLAFVQWLLGIAAVIAAALWSRGADLTGPLTFPPVEKVDQMAGLVCLVLLLAGLQASKLLKAAESAVRKMTRWLLHLKNAQGREKVGVGRE